MDVYHRPKNPPFLAGGGNMGSLIRAFNWSASTLGSPENWPTELKLAVSLVLSTPFPMYIAWGTNYIQLYNDAFRPILGKSKHPSALGSSSRETFAEIWETIGRMFAGVMQGNAVGFPDFMVQLDRNGYLEDCYFDFAYSPIMNVEGAIGGIMVTVVETTESKKALDELNHAKEALELAQATTSAERDRLRHFFMQAPAGICILSGPGFTYELVNQHYQNLFPGRTLLGKPLLEALPELKGQPIWEVLQNVYHTGQLFEGRGMKVPLPDDHGVLQDYYFNFIYQPRFNTAGLVDGIMVFVFDVTELVRSRQAIEDSEKRFRSMVESSPVAMLVTKGENMVFETINEPMLALIGGGDEIRGKAWFEAMPELRDQPIMDILYGAYREGKEWNGNEQPIIISKDGREQLGYYNISYTPLRENGFITGVLQSAVDVTEFVRSKQKLRESQENFRLLADNISQLAWITDETGSITWYNKRWYDYTGLGFEALQGWGWEQVQHPDYLQKVKNRFVEFIRRGETWEDVFPLKSAEGEYRWFLSRATPMRDNEGKIVKWFGTNTDITDQRNLMLQKDDFISIASHELKTPLTSLKGYIQLSAMIAEQEQFNPIVAALEKADLQVNRMNAMIKSFLDVARLESGGFRLNEQLFDPGVLVEEVVGDIALMTPDHHFVVSGTGPVMVNGDREKIGAVVSNFLTNAIKYSPPGSEINISLEQTAGEITCRVRDRGVGISREHIDKIFERFYRVNNAKSTTIAGFGIGLYYCQEIIRLHHGSIHVESEPGEGSAFSFSLPLAQPDQPPA